MYACDGYKTSEIDDRKVDPVEKPCCTRCTFWVADLEVKVVVEMGKIR
jgi:hypothetical protein